MAYTTYLVVTNGELYHHGIKGQKWGVRRYQNPDGSLTEAGLKRYGEHGSDYLNAKSNLKAAQKEYNKKHFVGNVIRKTSQAAGAGFAGDLAATMYEHDSLKKQKDANREYIIKRHDMLNETGRRKALKGPVQTKGEDEADYGRRGAKRIAQRQNKKGMTRNQAVKREKIIKGLKTVGSLSVSGLALYNKVSGGKVTNAAFKGGVRVAKATANGIKAAKKVYNDYYNMSVLDASGKVLKRYHDSFDFGERVVSGLLTA